MCFLDDYTNMIFIHIILYVSYILLPALFDHNIMFDLVV